MLRIGLSAGLALVALSGCYDESQTASEPVDPIQVLKQAHVREIAGALTQAYDMYERKDYDGCNAICNYVQSREPEYPVAREFAEHVVTTRGREKLYDLLTAFIEAKDWGTSEMLCDELNRTACTPGESLDTISKTVQKWKEQTDAGANPTVPMVDTLTYPHLGLPKTAEPEPVFPSAPESLSCDRME